MHLALFYGFLFLLFFHALDRHITIRLFPEYVSTLNPFLFLRNFFGAFLLLGLAIAAYRRFRDKVLRLTTGRQDIFTLVLLGVIILSGFTAGGSKIVSPHRFHEMVQEYATIQETGNSGPCGPIGPEILGWSSRDRKPLGNRNY